MNHFEVVKFGESVQGRDLSVRRFGHSGRLTLMIFAIHGDERATYPLGEIFARKLDEDPELWAGQRVDLILLANPDGWSLATRTNSRGVDLNRNFADGWVAEPRSAKHHPGPASFSEPESRALADWTELSRPAQIVSVHQPLDLMNYDGEATLPLATAMAEASGYPLVADLENPTPGSYGKFCLRLGIPIVTLEMADGELAEPDRTKALAALVAALEHKES